MFSSTLQERDTNGAVEFSVGQHPLRHHNKSPLMDFIDNNIFHVWGVHPGVPLGFGIEKPANPSASETRRKRDCGMLANLHSQFRLHEGFPYHKQHHLSGWIWQGK